MKEIYQVFPPLARDQVKKNRNYLAICFLLFSSLMVAQVSIAADDLEITDEYLKGLSEEVSSPEYILQAKQELIKSEKIEQSKTAPSAEIIKATVDIDAFENLMRSDYPASYKIYNELPTHSRISVFRRFKETKKLSAAKRKIIDLYLNL